MANRSKKKRVARKSGAEAPTGSPRFEWLCSFAPSDFWIALLLATVTFLVYWPSLKSDLVYDAREEILTEGFITTTSNLPSVLSLKVLGMNLMLGDRPGQMLYMMLIAAISGKNPFGYHLGSNLLHATNVALLYLLIARLSSFEATQSDRNCLKRLQFSAIAAALFFALHPLAVESVSEVSYSSSLLVTCFSFLALLAASAFKPRDVRSEWIYGACGVASAFAAVASKESGITAALIIVAYRFLFRQKEDTKPWFWFISATMAVTAAFLAARFLLAPPARDVYHYLGGSLSNVFWIQPRVWVFMMGQIAWPTHLSADYTAENIRGYSTTGAIAVLVLVISFQGWLANKSRIGALGVALYWLALATVSNFVPLYRFTADRFYYMPLAGLSLQLFALLTLPRSQTAFRIAAGSIFLSLFSLAALTLKRQAVFSNQYALWTETLRISPYSEVAHTGLGIEFRNRGQTDKARQQFEMAPNYYLAQNNLANMYYEDGKVDAALNHYQKAIDLNPNYPEAHDNFGMALERKGQMEDAIVQFKKTIELNPEYVDAHTNLGIALWSKGQAPEALAEFEKAARLRPNDPATQKNLAMAKKAMNR
jgi:tetratricopeptide (TPR) repeat protein